MRTLAIALLGLLFVLPALVHAGDRSTSDSAASKPAAGKCALVKSRFVTSCKPIPASAKSEQDWCDEHSLAESQCTKCNPELATQSPD